MANSMGHILEDISIATGSVAHFYKTLEMQNHGQEGRVQHTTYEEIFKPLIEHANVLRSVPGGAPEQEEAPPLEVLKSLTDIMTPQDYVKLFMGMFPQLNHLVPKLHETLNKLKDHPKCGGSVDKVSELLAKELS